MTLKIWTGADAPLIKKTLGATLKSFRPDIPPHQFIEFNPLAEPPLPEKGEVILVCGNKPLDVLRKHGIAPKSRTVSSLREKPIAANGGHYLITFDPFITNNEPEKQEVIDWDTRLAVRLMRTQGLAPEIGEYRWVNDFQPTIDWIEKRYAVTGKPVDVSIDTETMGFFPWYPDRDIVTFQVTAKPGTAEVLYLGPQEHPIKLDPSVPLFDQIEWLLTSPKVKLRGANLKFDLLWIAEKWGIECTNFKFDICLVGNLLNENRSNSLNLLTKVMTPMGGYDDDFNDNFDKGHMEAIPAGGKLLTYAGGDTDACHQVADVLRDELSEDPKLATFYIKVLHPAARAFENIERRGVLVDREKYEALGEEVAIVVKENMDKAMSLLPNKMKIKYRERIDAQISAGKSPLLPSILKEYFFTPHGLNLKPKERTAKTGEPSMQKSHLRQFAEVPEAVAMVAALTAMDVASKTKSTFIDGFLKHLRPDGRLHPTYMLFHGALYDDEDDESGTVTGRLSAKDPPFQIIPKKTLWAKKIRSCFPAPPGKVMIQLDFSQGELRVVACVANEKAMIAAYEAGLDLHAVTGARLGGVPYDEFMAWKDAEDEKKAKMFEDLRQQAKAGNFGLLYGMGVDGFQAYAWANYGLRLTYADAEKIRDDFFELYSGLKNYHDRQRELVRMREMVRSPLGRVRHLPMIRSWDREVKSRAERQAINSPIQSTLSDMMLWAIALIDDAYPQIEIVGMIHDALIAYVPEQDASLWAGRAQEVMSNLPFHEVGWHPVLKFPADAEAGPNLAELKKLKLVA